MVSIESVSVTSVVTVESVSVSTVMSVSVWDARTVVDQVDVTEVTVVVVGSVGVVIEGGVTGSRGAWLFVGVSIGADHEGGVVSVVETVISTFTYSRRNQTIGCSMLTLIR